MTAREFIDSAVGAARRALHADCRPGGVHKPEFGGNEWRYVKECDPRSHEQRRHSYRPAWTLMNELPIYQNAPSMDFSVVRHLVQRIVSFPSSAVPA